MITKAKVIWEVNVTLDIPNKASKEYARDMVNSVVLRETNFIKPKIVECIERPDLIGELLC